MPGLERRLRAGDRRRGLVRPLSRAAATPPTPRITRSSRSASWRRAPIEEAERAHRHCRARRRDRAGARRRHLAVRARPSTPRWWSTARNTSTASSTLDVAAPPLSRSSPASCSTSSTASLKPHGLWFPVDISTASRATIGGMAGNNSCGGRRCATAPCATTCSLSTRCWPTARARISAVSAPTSPTCRADPRRALADDLLAIGAREADEIAARFPARCSAASAATISTRWCRAVARRHQPRASAGRLRRHARLFHPHRIEAVAAARPPRASASAISAVSTRRWTPPSISSRCSRSRSNSSTAP